MDTGSLLHILMGSAYRFLMAQTTFVVALPRHTIGVQGAAVAAHDGRLRWAAGVQNMQVVRAVSDDPSQGSGNTTVSIEQMDELRKCCCRDAAPSGHSTCTCGGTVRRRATMSIGRHRASLLAPVSAISMGTPV